MKMREKEIAKLDGQMLVLQEQSMMIEGANSDQSVVNAMKQGAGAIKELNELADVDDIAELQDELADMKADADERGEEQKGHYHPVPECDHPVTVGGISLVQWENAKMILTSSVEQK